MEAKGLLSAMASCRCPRCRTGKVFYGHPYSFKRQRSNQVCAHCGLYFEIEPGYFYISMYISYGFAVVETLITAFILYSLTHSESPWLYGFVLISIIILMAPINYRYSRIALLYMTPKIKYDPRYHLDDQ